MGFHSPLIRPARLFIGGKRTLGSRGKFEGKVRLPPNGQDTKNNLTILEKARNFDWLEGFFQVPLPKKHGQKTPKSSPKRFLAVPLFFHKKNTTCFFSGSQNPHFTPLHQSSSKSISGGGVYSKHSGFRSSSCGFKKKSSK